MIEIEAEFDRQKKLAEKWKEEAATSQIIAAMNQDEIKQYLLKKGYKVIAVDNQKDVKDMLNSKKINEEGALF